MCRDHIIVMPFDIGFDAEDNITLYRCCGQIISDAHRLLNHLRYMHDMSWPDAMKLWEKCVKMFYAATK